MRDANSIRSFVFHDCDAYFDAIEHVNVRFTLQGLESNIWRINGLALPRGVDVQYCRSGSGSIAQGVSRDGGLELALPITGQYTANAKPVPWESALCIAPGSEFLASIPNAHSWFGIFVPEAMAISSGMLAKSADLARIRTHVRRNAAQGKASVTLLLKRFFANVLAAPEISKSKQALGRFETELLSVLGKAYGQSSESTRKNPGRVPIVGHRVVRHALDVIESSPEPTVSMSELVEIADVSERSLRAGFRKHLGMSPARYMQLRTLNRAQRRLASSRPGEVSVAEIATDLGVWDLGRFAARYRRLFGELPSSTLRRSR